MSYLKKYHDESWHTPRGRAIREIVFGVNDGLVTTVGFVAGLSGALSNARLILLGGLAELVAGAISMFFGAYLSTKSQRDFFRKEIERERREIEEMPEIEKEEIREIYSKMGFSEKEVEILVSRISSDKDLWMRFMMREELGLIEEKFDNPLVVGLLMGISFVLGAIPPLLPFMLIGSAPLAFAFSIPLSLLALFLIGVGMTTITKRRRVSSGLEVLIIGAAAAGIGFIIGKIVSHLLGEGVAVF